MSVFSVCDRRVNHKEGAVQRRCSKIDAYSDIHFEKHLHFSGRELIITLFASLFTSLCLLLTLPLLSVSNTAKTSALCRWVSLSRLPTTGSSLNGHLMRHTVKRKRSSCRKRTLFPTWFLIPPPLDLSVPFSCLSICCHQQHFCKTEDCSLWGLFVLQIRLKNSKELQNEYQRHVLYSWWWAQFCSGTDIKERNKTTLQINKKCVGIWWDVAADKSLQMFK